MFGREMKPQAFFLGGRRGSEVLGLRVWGAPCELGMAALPPTSHPGRLLNKSFPLHPALLPAPCFSVPSTTFSHPLSPLDPRLTSKAESSSSQVFGATAASGRETEKPRADACIKAAFP